MNEQSICFIMCSNNGFLAKECIRYIDSLNIPEGMDVQYQVITGAESMASGYNEAMSKSSAKYKVYLHQDVLLVHKNFLIDTIKLFKKYPQVGMLGVVGNNSLPEDGCPWSDGMDRRCGRLYADLISNSSDSVFSAAGTEYEKAVVLDGLLMMTQYDIKWREDLFRGWDFYDCSQSMEFWKAGYEVAVPKMEASWCLHDNDVINLDNYDRWRKIFVREYAALYRNRTGESMLQAVRDSNMPAVIYQKFDNSMTDVKFPYQPLVVDSEADYLCFSTDKNVHSNFWKMIYVDSYEQSELEPYLEKYRRRYELKSNQIQTAHIFSDIEPDVQNVITVPGYDELPDVHPDLSKFTKTYDDAGKYIYKRNPVYNTGIYEGRDMLLTVAMPVSNQVETIRRCLESLKPLLDAIDSELLIVDTGSNDGTIDICREYNARIIEMPWPDNMSEVRNYAINNAKGLWYLSIDDDEWFEDVGEILDFFVSGKYKEYDYAIYYQKNYLTLDGRAKTTIPALRIARISPELHFEGRIHDALIVPDCYTRGYEFKAYVNHYGFALDDVERMKKKYVRNATGLIYDMIDNPTDLRYSFQLGNELNVRGYFAHALNISIRAISLDKENGDSHFGRLNAMNAYNALHNLDGEEIIYYKTMLSNLYKYTDVEKAFFEYGVVLYGIRHNLEEEKVLKHIHAYWDYYNAFQNNQAESLRNTLIGLKACQSEGCRMDMVAAEFCCYSRLNQKENAVKILDKILIEKISDMNNCFVETFVRDDMDIFNAVLDKFSYVDAELWSFTLIKGALENTLIEVKWEYHRLGKILDKMSITSAERACAIIENNFDINWFYDLAERIGTLEYSDMNIQELYFYSYIYKKIYLTNKDSAQGFDSFMRYAALRGCLAEKLYNPEVINNDGLCGITPEDKALYHIKLALSKQNDVKEAIAHLKKAVGYFPAFKNEIGKILSKLEKAGQVSEKSSKDSEIVKLAEQIKKNAEKLIMLEKYKDAEMLLKEILKYVPDDSEILDLIQLCNN